MTPKSVDMDDRRHVDSAARTSAVPLLAPELSEGVVVDDSNVVEDDPAGAEQDSTKPGKRRFFGLGRRRDDVGALPVDDKRSAGPVGQTSPPRAISPTSVPSSSGRPSTSPPIPNHPYQHPSASCRHARSPSPGLPSPASSSIFERDVQESALPAPPSGGIPSHIPREDYIPPVLEASSLAITDERLDPDDVKIVMHANHHPAVAGHGSMDASIATLPDEVATTDRDGTASSYGALDAHDHRRLSFISFADVVQAEHMTGKDGIPVTGLPLTASPPLHHLNRSPSPVYSGASSRGLSTSPPTSGPASVGGFEGISGAGVKGPGSPNLGHAAPTAAGELTIETMRQALRKTGSSDLGGVRSQPLSATSGDDFSHEVPWR